MLFIWHMSRYFIWNVDCISSHFWYCFRIFGIVVFPSLVDVIFNLKKFVTTENVINKEPQSNLQAKQSNDNAAENLTSQDEMSFSESDTNSSDPDVLVSEEDIDSLHSKNTAYEGMEGDVQTNETHSKNAENPKISGVSDGLVIETSDIGNKTSRGLSLNVSMDSDMVSS